MFIDQYLCSIVVFIDMLEAEPGRRGLLWPAVHSKERREALAEPSKHHHLTTSHWILTAYPPGPEGEIPC